MIIISDELVLLSSHHMVTKTIDISGGVFSQLAWDDVNTNVLLNGWIYPFCITISD